MRFFRPDLLALALGMCLVTPIGVRSQQEATDAADLVGSRLTLNLRPVTVSFFPALSADESDHRQLLMGSGTSAVRVHVGELEGGARLRIGTLDGSTTDADADDADADDAPGPRSNTYELWLTQTRAGWALEAQAVSSDEAATSVDVVGSIPLSHGMAAEAADTFSAAIVPTGDDTGQLVLRWGEHEWTADFRFADPPAPADEDEDDEEEEEEEEPGDVRAFDDDGSAFTRVVTLTERHEAAIVLPDDSRIGVLFWKAVSVEHDDFAAIASLADGDVLRLTEAAVIRLRTEVPLQFGRVTIPTGNLAAGFPGSYGLWLKRAGADWRLVFNHEADSWGTQHDPAFDAAEIEMEYSRNGRSARPLGVELVPTSARSGRLVIHWGGHEWSADFTFPASSVQ